MLWYIGASLLLIVAFIFYRFFVKPKKLKAYYVQNFKARGLRVYEFPTKLLGSPNFVIMLNDSKRGDAFMTFKKLYADYDIAIGNSFSKIQIALLSPDLIKQFAKNQQEMAYIKRRDLHNNLRRVIGDGLLLSEGEDWKKKRKIFSKIFTYQFISSKHDDIAKICDTSLCEVQSNASISQSGQKFTYDILKYSSYVALNVVTQCFLGGKSQNQKINGISVADFLFQLIDDVTLQTYTAVALIFGPRFLNLGLRKFDRKINKNIKLLNNWGIEYIEQKISEAGIKLLENPDKSPENIIEALLINNKNNPEDYQFTSNDILQEFKTFFLAGTDTSSHYIQVMVAYLCQNPEAQKQLRKEIDKVFEDGFDYSYKKIKCLKYLDAVQKQTTRMYGPLSFNFPRVAVRDHIIGGIPVFKGTLVKYNMLGIHYGQKYFKEPYKFRPERWLNGECDHLDSFTLVGFGVSTRSCIGKHLAMVEGKITLIKLLKRYKSIEMRQTLMFRWKFAYSTDNFNIQAVINK